MNRKTSTALFVALNFTIAIPSLAQSAGTSKKVISFSGPPNARAFHDNVVEMERLMPVVDGVTLYPVTDNGGVITEALGRLFRPNFHRLKDFDSGIDLMRSADTRLYRDNFLLVYLTSGLVDLEIPDWLDPEFNAVINNWQVAAEYAKRAGIRGLLFDDEVYYGRSLWTYHRLKHKDTTTADEYSDQVFERGAQIMRAINSVYPDIEILSLHGPTHASLNSDKLWRNRYAMMRAFFDGLLSECTGDATIIDGSERTYGYYEASQFERAAETFKNARSHSRVPEQFDRHARVAFPIFLGSRGFSTEDHSRNHYSPAELTTALRGALEHTDKYVWIYTERVSLWNRPGVTFLPEEYRDAMLAAHDPAENVPTAIAETLSVNLPQRHALERNFPNPFNGTTVIPFALGKQQSVELTIYNLAGQEVVTLLRGTRSAGTHTIHWDGRNTHEHDVASGVYFYQLHTNEWQATRQLLLVR